MAAERGARSVVLLVHVPGARWVPELAGAFYDTKLGEFILPYDEVRRATHPDAAVQDFLQTTYEAGADLAGWDRAMLEPADLPDRPPRRPWSTLGEGTGSTTPASGS